jgi:hypothetical protein
MEIKRYYPVYPCRYTNEVFDRFNEMSETEIRENYNKWKEGINPFTNRKIKLGGKTHYSIRDDLMISFLHGSRWRSVYYLKLIEIDQEKYKEETIQLNHEIDSTIEKINRLQSWNDYVEFHGMKYGLKMVLNDVHRENDCFGQMEYIEKQYKCRGCRNHVGLCHTFTINKCNKCGYE